MTTTNSQHKNIQVYLLAAPQDQSVCEDLTKHLKPIIRNSPTPVEVGSDFDIPSGADKEEYKQRLFVADIVLALISVDFIDSDDIYNRNQKVIERYNNKQTVMIPILVRNCMWKATPFSSLPVVPKNLQPLNNKQYWNSPDDAVMDVVNDIYSSINELSKQQAEAVQPHPVTKVESASAEEMPVKPSPNKVEPPAPAKESIQAQIKEVQAPPPAQDMPVKPSPSKVEPPAPAKELVPAQAKEVQAPTPARESPVKSSPRKVIPPVPAKAQVKEVQPTPAIQTASVSAPPNPKVASTPSIRQAASPAPIAVDWREKYYRTVAMKRAVAYLIDYILVFIVSLIIVVIVGDPEGTITFFLSVILYLVVMPLMESSKWQGTIGKRLLKLQITNREGERIKFFQALGRNIMRLLVFYAYFLSFGVLLIVQYFRFQKTKKLFHDEISGTVIGERLANSGEVQIAASAA